MTIVRRPLGAGVIVTWGTVKCVDLGMGGVVVSSDVGEAGASTRLALSPISWDSTHPWDASA